MSRGWWCCALSLGFFVLAAEVPAPPRRVALKIETGRADQTPPSLLPGLTEALHTGLQAEGVDLVLAGSESQGLPVLRIAATSQWNKEAMGTQVKVLGWLSAPSSEAHGVPPKAIASEWVFKDKRQLGDSVNQAALVLARDLLLGAQASQHGDSKPRWVMPPPSGGTRVEGKVMKLEGAAPPLEYPWEARVMRVGGDVSLDLQVDRKGIVNQVAVTNGALPLVDGALAYASGLRFHVPAELQERAPLTFGLSLRYRLPSICKVSRTVLEIADGRSKETGLQPKLDVIRQSLVEMLEREGVQCVNAPSPEDLELRHLRIEIETLQARNEICLYGVRGRISSYVDRNLETVTPFAPLSIVQEGLVAGQRGETGFRDSLLRSVQAVVCSIVESPRPERQPLLNAIGAPSPGITNFDFSQIRIKHQPPAPPYPSAARLQRIQGTVVVEIEVDEEGRPIRGIVRKGPAELMLTALAYALDWSFEPAKVNGKPVKARFKLTQNFKLR